VAAHVLLTLLSHVEYGTSPWNGLKIAIGSNGDVQFDPSQRADLAGRWLTWYKTKPHPRSLPLK
jgi:hypothetical protein